MDKALAYKRAWDRLRVYWNRDSVRKTGISTLHSYTADSFVGVMDRIVGEELRKVEVRSEADSMNDHAASIGSQD